MKGLSNKIVNSLTGKDLKTTAKPRTELNGEVTLSTDKGFHIHAYILNKKALKFTENNRIVLKLPKKSNIKDLIPELDKTKKRIKGDKLKSSNDEYTKIRWMDQYGRQFASMIETRDRISFPVRPDIANDLFLQGKILVQCTTAMCDLLSPTKVCFDTKKQLAIDPVVGKM